MNPVCRLRDGEDGSSGDVVPDPPESFLLCVSETWDKLKKQLTVGLVVSLTTSLNPSHFTHTLERLSRTFLRSAYQEPSFMILRCQESYRIPEMFFYHTVWSLHVEKALL